MGRHRSRPRHISAALGSWLEGLRPEHHPQPVTPGSGDQQALFDERVFDFDRDVPAPPLPKPGFYDAD